jgi:hypothetical protein
MITISVKNSDGEVIINREDGMTIDELYNDFNAIAIALTYQQVQVDNYIMEKAEELNNDIEFKVESILQENLKESSENCN